MARILVVDDEIMVCNMVARRTAVLTDTVARLHRTYDLTIEALAAALDLKDSETMRHCKSVAELSLRIATRLGITDEVILRDLRWGALLHDLGKIGVPDAILQKPGPLTDAERLVVQKHPALIVLYHHERFDGSGYPTGLCGDAIPLTARIFAIADAVDVLLRGRVYREPFTQEAVRAEIERSTGTHFDPRIVEAYLSLEFSASAVPS